MKFRTMIEIVTEAENKNEALEIAGEYLSGNLASGVHMRCATRAIPHYNKSVITIVTTALVLTVCLIALLHLRPSNSFTGNASSINAVQAPLNTSVYPHKSEFKKEWQTEQTKEALDHLRSNSVKK